MTREMWQQQVLRQWPNASFYADQDPDFDRDETVCAEADQSLIGYWIPATYWGPVQYWIDTSLWMV
jgi:hypothetical protein